MAFVRERTTGPFHVPRRIGGAPKVENDLAALHSTEEAGQLLEDSPEDSQVDPLETALAEAQERGYREGFERGKAEGLQVGKEEGDRDGRQTAKQEVLATLDPQLARVRSLCGALTQPFAALKRTLAEAIVDGAQRLASGMVSELAATDSTALIQMVSDILGEVSVMEGGRNRLEVRVHPEALKPVRELVNEAIAEHSSETTRITDVTVAADSHLAPGDVQAVLFPSSGEAAHRIEWDARLEERWNTIRTHLGLTTR